MGKNKNFGGKTPRTTGVSKAQLRAVNARIDRLSVRIRRLAAEMRKRGLDPEQIIQDYISQRQP